MLTTWNILKAIVMHTFLMDIATSYRSFVIDIDHISYEIDEKIVKNFHMELLSCGYHNKIKGSFIFAEDLHELDYVVWAKTHRKDTRTLIFNTTINACQIMENSGRKMNPITLGAVNVIKRYMPDLFAKCPFKKDKIRYVDNLYFDEELFPVLLPNGNFSAVFNIVHKNKNVVKLLMLAHVLNKDDIDHSKKRSRNTCVHIF